MALAIVFLIIVVASVLFHILSPWHQTEAASNWGSIDDTLLLTVIITGIFFIGITVFMAVALIRFRHGKVKRARYEPENKKLEWWLMGITSVGVIGMLAPGLFVYGDFVSVPEDAAEFEVLGQQWQWSYRFPGEDGLLGTADTKWMSMENPFGLNPEDPNGQDDILVQSNEVHLPLGKPTKVLLRSKDVLHNFYVPHFRAKMDMVPGLVSYFWFTPTQLGKYEVLCAEFCGLAHYNMRGHVVVDEEAQFQAWLQSKPTFKQSLSKTDGASQADLIEQGRQLAQNQGCLACHSVDGAKMLGPTWKDLYGKTETLTDGSTVSVDEAYLRESITNPKVKMVQGYPPVMVAYDFNEQQMAAIIAYTKSLSEAYKKPPSEPANSAQEAETIDDAQGSVADPEEIGRELAQSQGCLACHSMDGAKSIGPTWKRVRGQIC